jgi:hypothetical protein
LRLGESTSEGSLAFLAIPAPVAQTAGDSTQKIILPENIRTSLQRRLRLGRPTTQQ